MSPTHVLVVDDSPLSRRLMTYLLESYGYRVEVAHDAVEARARIAACRPELILMDIHLPGTDGLTLTRELKADPDTAVITIVALTASGGQQDEQRALDAGCDGFLSKPVDINTLPDTLADFLTRAP